MLSICMSLSLISDEKIVPNDYCKIEIGMVQCYRVVNKELFKN